MAGDKEYEETGRGDIDTTREVAAVDKEIEPAEAEADFDEMDDIEESDAEESSETAEVDDKSEEYEDSGILDDPFADDPAEAEADYDEMDDIAADEEREEESDEEEDEEDPDVLAAQAEAAAAAAVAAAAAAEAAKKAAEAKKKAKQKSKSSKSDGEGKGKKSSEKSKSSEKKSDEKPAEKETPSDDEEVYTTEPREGDLVGGVFTPNKPYKEPKELDESERFIDPTRISGKAWFTAAFVVLILGVVAVFVYAEKPQDVEDVFLGQLKAKRAAERERIEEEHRLEELKKMNKFGMLLLQGNPQYATLKFNGSQRYGLTSNGEWRALILKGDVPIKNLNIKDPLDITVENPGFKPSSQKITEGGWQKNPSGDDYTKLVTTNLEPIDEIHKMEFDQRLLPNVDTEFFGTVTINSTPPGAYVIFDGHPLKNKDGKSLTTPVTFTANYVFDETTKKFEEKPVKVDTVLDIGHKIEVGIEYPNTCKPNQTECVNDDGCCPAGPKCNVATDTDCKLPILVDSLQRQNWTCNFDEEKKAKILEEIKADKAKPSAIQSACNYTFTLNADLAGIKKFAQQQEEERLRVLRYNEQIGLGSSGEDGDAAAGGEEETK